MTQGRQSRTLIGAVTIGLVLAVAMGPVAHASPAPRPFACSGTPIVSVIALVRNEADGGVTGHVWAVDGILEQARIWQETSTTFCVVETDVGSFHSFAGVSPGGTGTISAGRTGLTLGIQRFELNATLHPIAPVRGYLGAFDFKCDQLGNCPGNVRFSSLYFTNITSTSGSAFAEFDVSTSPHRQTWFQSGTTSVGDITG